MAWLYSRRAASYSFWIEMLSTRFQMAGNLGPELAAGRQEYREHHDPGHDRHTQEARVRRKACARSEYRGRVAVTTSLTFSVTVCCLTAKSTNMMSTRPSAPKLRANHRCLPNEITKPAITSKTARPSATASPVGVGELRTRL